MAQRTKAGGSTTRKRGAAGSRKKPASGSRPQEASGRPPGGETYRETRLANSRFGIVYDIDGPRVRLGIVWFVAAVVACAVATAALAVVVAAVAALAAAQTAQALRNRWRRPSLGVAAAVGASIPLAAAFGVALAGLTIVVATIAATLLAGAVRPRRTDPLVDSGAVVRSAVFVGLGAAALVVLHRFDVGAAITLLVMASAYEAGDYLIGSGASNAVEGPLSGVLALVVVTGALAVAQPPPFTGGGLWLYAVVAGATIPIGQVIASAILPRAGAPAPALRRLDSYLLSGPTWLVLLWAGVGT
jgi:hypothetical protein